MSRTRVALLIRSLNPGGAERQLALLARGLADRGHDVFVYTFYPPTDQDAVNVGGARLISLDKRGRGDVLSFGMRLRSELRRSRPAVIYSFLPDANVFAALMRLSGVHGRFVWGVRAARVEWGQYARAARWSFLISAALSRVPDAIVYNSRAGVAYHMAQGYRGRRQIVIPNGFDVEEFRPDPDARNRIRQEWQVPADAVVIGLVGRVDPMKGQTMLLDAAAQLPHPRSNLRLAFAGAGTELASSGELSRLAHARGLGEHCIWAGPRRDMRAVYNALDVAVLASRAEGLPNVVGEAMACGVPCVVTPAGDSADLVGDTGQVAAAASAAALANALREMLALSAADRRRLGLAARARIQQQFGIPAMIERTETALLGSR